MPIILKRSYRQDQLILSVSLCHHGPFKFMNIYTLPFTNFVLVQPNNPTQIGFMPYSIFLECCIKTSTDFKIRINKLSQLYHCHILFLVAVCQPYNKDLSYLMQGMACDSTNKFTLKSIF